MIFVLEDRNTEMFYPISLTRASFEVRVGFYTLIERTMSQVKKDDKVVLIVRPNIKDVVADRYPDCEVFSNDIQNFPYSKEKVIDSSVNTIWDAIYSNHKMLEKDFESARTDRFDKSMFSDCTFYGNKIYIDHSAIVKSSIIDSDSGPVYIDKGVRVGPGAIVQGPVYIGKGSIVNPGSKIRGNVSIGPVCKVGGEIEDSIFQGYSNKQHDGFLGHSFVGEWVNLGANTNVSNLKNTYGNIKVNLESQIINTGKNFLGSLIGDHVKTAISTNLNTGSTIGFGANVFNNDFSSKFIKSFAWGHDGSTDFEKFLLTTRKVKARRGQEVSNSEIKLFKSIFINRIK